MDLSLSPEQQAFRTEVRSFLQDALTPAMRQGATLTSGVFAEPDVYLAPGGVERQGLACLFLA